MQNEWWSGLTEEIQTYADAGNRQQFYSALKAAYGAKRGVQVPVRSADGQVLINEKSDVLQRWAKHFRGLLNQQPTFDPEAVQCFPQLPVMHEGECRQTGSVAADVGRVPILNACIFREQP